MSTSYVKFLILLNLKNGSFVGDGDSFSFCETVCSCRHSVTVMGGG